MEGKNKNTEHPSENIRGESVLKDSPLMYGGERLNPIEETASLRSGLEEMIKKDNLSERLGPVSPFASQEDMLAVFRGSKYEDVAGRVLTKAHHCSANVRSFLDSTAYEAKVRGFKLPINKHGDMVFPRVVEGELAKLMCEELSRKKPRGEVKVTNCVVALEICIEDEDDYKYFVEFFSPRKNLDLIPIALFINGENAVRRPKAFFGTNLIIINNKEYKTLHETLSPDIRSGYNVSAHEFQHTLNYIYRSGILNMPKNSMPKQERVKKHVKEHSFIQDEVIAMFAGLEGIEIGQNLVVYLKFFSEKIIGYVDKAIDNKLEPEEGKDELLNMVYQGLEVFRQLYLKKKNLRLVINMLNQFPLRLWPKIFRI